MSSKNASASSELDQQEAPADACTCTEKKLIVEVREKRPCPENAAAEEDLLYKLCFNRSKPRTILTKIQFCLACFFTDVVPMFCCPPCPGPIIRKLAFRPPECSTYDFIPFGPLENGDYRLQLKLPAAEYLRLRYRRYPAYTALIRCYYIKCESIGRIACMYARSLAPSAMIEPLTILYSHNNGIDLGLTLGKIIVMARRFRIDFFAYDYAGYGRSGSTCSEANLYKSAEQAYDFLTKTLCVPPEQIVAIGTSLGTAATIHLASSNRPLRGVVLQGAFLSALRVVCPKRPCSCNLDRFENVHKISTVRCPTLFVHGEKDKVFSVQHARMLRGACPGAADIEPLIIPKCGHIDFDYHSMYWQRLHQFFHEELSDAASRGPCCSYHPVHALMMTAPPSPVQPEVAPLITLCDICLTAEAEPKSTQAKTSASVPGSKSLVQKPCAHVPGPSKLPNA